MSIETHHKAQHYTDALNDAHECEDDKCTHMHSERVRLTSTTNNTNININIKNENEKAKRLSGMSWE